MSSARHPVQLVTFGESMVAFVFRDDSRDVVTTIAGAETNLAVALAELGCRVRWVSRVGDDLLGRRIVGDVRARGVDVVAEPDPARPTGVLVRHVADGLTRVQYYRSRSAARALAPQSIALGGDAEWCHLTGITVAISPAAAELVTTILDPSQASFDRRSFDVNYRPALWPDAETARRTLLPLAQRADVLFVGDDESEALFGTSDVGALADLLLRRTDQELVLKRGSGPASLVTRHDVVTEPSRPVSVVDPTGAGDAFAAGYLAGRIFDLAPASRLRLAHRMGAWAVRAVDDMVAPLGAAESEELQEQGLVPTASQRHPLDGSAGP